GAREGAEGHGRRGGLGGAGGEEAEQRGGGEGLPGRSPAMTRVFAALRAVEASDTTILVRGEPGSGKELTAQAIHARSRRRLARFVAVDLAALPPDEREPALFGPVGPAADPPPGGPIRGAAGGRPFIRQGER